MAEVRCPPAERFWARVAVADGDACWEWTGNCFQNGYGRISVDHQGVGTHRFSWELHHGPIPEGMYVCHRCDNKRCCRPDHLFLGTPADNMRDMVRKGRSQSGSRNHNARLNEDQADEIRRRYAEGNVTQLELAIEFGVVEGCIWNVLHHRVFRVAA